MTVPEDSVPEDAVRFVSYTAASVCLTYPSPYLQALARLDSITSPAVVPKGLRDFLEEQRKNTLKIPASRRTGELAVSVRLYNARETPRLNGDKAVGRVRAFLGFSAQYCVNSGSAF